MSQPTCAHCGGLHYGSVPGHCPYICDTCHCDIRPDAMPRCACSPKPQPPGFFERQRELRDAIAAEAENYRLVGKNSGVGMIVDERLRQIKEEGWTPEHDDEHDFQELSKAALCYTDYAILVNLQGHDEETFWESHAAIWPWDKEWWKPSPDPIRNFVKAGALLAADIDRLKRAEDKK
jgi:hypothetical protein